MVLAAEAELSRIRKELPPEINRELDAVSFHFELLPSAEELADGIEADQLGLFDGNALGEAEFPLPTRIVIWLQNLWEMAESDEEVFRDEIRITLLHEIGHFFGWDEDEIEARGLD